MIDIKKKYRGRKIKIVTKCTSTSARLAQVESKITGQSYHLRLRLKPQADDNTFYEQRTKKTL